MEEFKYQFNIFIFEYSIDLSHVMAELIKNSKIIS